MCVVGAAAVLLAGHAAAQLGSLATEGVQVAGTVAVIAGRATIANNGTVTTDGNPADISLTRGGTVRVCAGSSANLSQPAAGVARPPLQLALNRGAMEVRTAAAKNDVLLTPDFRVELSDAAPLDLRIRLVSNGDTCVENAGKNAPILHVTEAFGTGAYFIRPGQRVLFEHGSLREVVDHEGSSCGCPKTEPLVLAGKGKRGNGVVTEAARNNPFPEAESSGLVKPTVPQASPDETHVQVSTAMNYNGATNTVTGPPGQTTGPEVLSSTGSTADSASSKATGQVSSAAAASPNATATGAAVTQVQSSVPPPAGPNPFRALGRFFRRLFGQGS